MLGNISKRDEPKKKTTALKPYKTEHCALSYKNSQSQKATFDVQSMEEECMHDSLKAVCALFVVLLTPRV